MQCDVTRAPPRARCALMAKNPRPIPTGLELAFSESNLHLHKTKPSTCINNQRPINDEGDACSILSIAVLALQANPSTRRHTHIRGSRRSGYEPHHLHTVIVTRNNSTNTKDMKHLKRLRFRPIRERPSSLSGIGKGRVKAAISTTGGDTKELDT
jgi:hypothetical protein